ncbi:hypothetical protein C7S18_19550 [Ahniella affigens]|uniref:Uncharacterized protein n=1 Tax=Ahniella affigens TaxID=2021234 RepID=A0A2P1PWI8_9GAMM|nr:hypothetical protein [Ahniella affigens]AVP99221.1 hypothetical protein C7S18_19550 [Ahniella affigens]
MLAIGIRSVPFGAFRRFSAYPLLTLTVLLAACASQPKQTATLAMASETPSEPIVFLEDAAASQAASACGISVAAGTGAPAPPEATASAAADPVFGLGKWIAGLILSQAKSVATRELGWDQEYNRFLALSSQLNEINTRLNALDARMDRLTELLETIDLRRVKSEYHRDFVQPVFIGTTALNQLACREAALNRARLLDRDVQMALNQRNIALDQFKQECRSNNDFYSIPASLTERLSSSGSILDSYKRAVILPRRFLVEQDTIEYESVFYRYHLTQVTALRLAAECKIRNRPDNADPNDPGQANFRKALAKSLYEDIDGPFRVARMDQVEQFLPTPLPEGLVFDIQNNLLWLNRREFGAHPYTSQRLSNRAVNVRLTRRGPSETGPWQFQLARFGDVEAMAALGQALPTVRRGDSGSSLYPATLKPFLAEIGLGQVAAAIPDSGDLSFAWTADAGRPIRRCHTLDATACKKWYDPHESLGRIAAIAPASGSKLRPNPDGAWYAPQQCRPNECRDFRYAKSGVISVCRDPNVTDSRTRCVADRVLGEWQAPGLYTSRPRPEDHFFAFRWSNTD